MTFSYQTTGFRVRYGETDQMGVVYHANYLNWFEIGRTEFLREAGINYRDLEERGLMLPVTDATLSFKQPARYDDIIEVCTSITQITPLRIEFGYEIYRVGEEQLLVSGGTKHVFTNHELRPVRLNRLLPDLYVWLETRSKGCES